MQILTREGIYAQRSASPYQPWGSTAPPSPGTIGGEYSPGGIAVTEKTALQLAAVWGSVSLIADSIATLPLKQWRMAGGEPKEIEPATVIQQPWPEITQRDFITQGSLSMLLRGNLWGDIVARDQKLEAYPEVVKLVHPDHARITRNLSSGEIEVRYWRDLVPLENVTRAMALSIPEGLEGLSPIEYLRNTMGLARAQDLWNRSFFANSARPDGVIEVPGDYDDDEVKAALDSWLQAHQGINYAHLPAMLTGGATWKPITMKPEEVQFLEQMQWSENVIAGRIYRVPPHMIGLMEKETAWGAGIEQMELGFVRNTLLIWLNRWEDLLRSWLPPKQFVTFDLSQRLRGDTLQRWSAYQIARVTGAMNNAEIRKAEGLPIVTDPDAATILENYAAPLNSAPVKPTSTGGAGGDKAD
jgi:HK97 family phage portal protein